MLITKGNFQLFKLLACVLALLLACCVLPRAQAAPRAPDVVAAEFYGWYLDALSADQDPLSDRHETFTRYVAKDLASKLLARLKNGKPHATDYFMQAASYRPAWQQRVRAETVRQRPVVADVLVTLGDDSEEGGPKQAVLLSMVLENGAWKIREVSPAGTYAPKSSADQPVI